MNPQALSVADWHADKACNAYAKAQYFARKERWKDYEASLMVYARHLKIADTLRCE